ncbi:hypothetical protein Desru_0052 [Desulforamulus ruminis DSM 2154]|uniref:Uncharacterized protein n=1 Tax=Desulforamulus ruminis (strain ATCC 23193 / DSM 2154 / NCIMB 8452 / DL) TaxID=696281 RepID=F6DL45_DESRL|nr:hypothetical protein Desru_0052 [Desulforamulus ruminis DSM 2154]
MCTLIGVIVFILITQYLLAMSVLKLCDDPNNTIRNVATFSAIASIAVLIIFLAKLLKFFTGKDLGQINYNFYSFEEFNSSDRNGNSPN